MSKRAAKSKAADSPGIPTWFLTYADTVTLLMTFFVMLMSFSTLSEEKFEKVKGSLMAHLGMVGQRRMSKDSLLLRRMLASSRMFVEGYENPPEYDPIGQVERDFKVRIHTTSLANVLNYKVTRQGFEIHILAGALFEEGTAEFKSKASRVLNLVGAACRHLPHSLRVLGRSDAFFFPSRRAETAEELALERAEAVCGYLHERGGIAVTRLSTAAEVGTGAAARRAGENEQIMIVVLRPTRRKNVL